MGSKMRILVTNTTNIVSTNQTFLFLNAYIPMQIKCDICNT